MMFRTTMLLAFSLASVSAAQQGNPGFTEGDRIEAAMPGSDPEVWYPAVFKSGRRLNLNYVPGYYSTITFDHKPPCCDKPTYNRYSTRCIECHDPYTTGEVQYCPQNKIRRSVLEELKEGDVIEFGRKWVMNWTKAWHFDKPSKAAFLRVDPTDDKRYIVKFLETKRVGIVYKESIRRPRSPEGARPLQTDVIEATKFDQGFSAKEGSTVEVKYVNPETKASEWCKAIFLRANPLEGFGRADRFNGKVGVIFFKAPTIWYDREASSDRSSDKKYDNFTLRFRADERKFEWVDQVQIVKKDHVRLVYSEEEAAAQKAAAEKAAAEKAAAEKAAAEKAAAEKLAAEKADITNAQFAFSLPPSKFAELLDANDAQFAAQNAQSTEAKLAAKDATINNLQQQLDLQKTQMQAQMRAEMAEMKRQMAAEAQKQMVAMRAMMMEMMKSQGKQTSWCGKN